MFSPLMFCVIGSLMNYSEIRYAAGIPKEQVNLTASAVSGQSFLTTARSEDEGRYEEYFGFQLEISLIAVVIIAQIKIKTNSAGFRLSDSFCAVRTPPMRPQPTSPPFMIP